MSAKGGTKVSARVEATDDPLRRRPRGGDEEQEQREIQRSQQQVAASYQIEPEPQRIQFPRMAQEELLDAVDESGTESCCAKFIRFLSILLIIATFPVSIFLCIQVVQEYERAVIFSLGRVKQGGPRGPGLFFIVPCTDQIRVTDLRTVSFDVPPQEILTKDSVTVAVDAVVYYRINSPMAAVCNVSDYSTSTKLLASTTLRTILGTKNLSEILSERETISNDILQQVDQATDPWGIKVERVEVKDVRLPQQMQRAMAAEAEAAREARAKVIAAEGEQKSSKALKEAADILGQSKSALQLRYLQTLVHISAEKNSTIVFPLPVDILSTFVTKEKLE